VTHNGLLACQKSLQSDFDALYRPGSMLRIVLTTIEKLDAVGTRSELWLLQTNNSSIRFCIKEHKRGLQFELNPDEAFLEASRSLRMARRCRMAPIYFGIKILRNDSVIRRPDFLREGDRVVLIMEFSQELVTLSDVVEEERTEGELSMRVRRALEATARDVAEFHKRKYLPRHRQTGHFTSDPRKLRDVYALHLQGVKQRLQENFIGPRGVIMDPAAFDAIESLVNRSIVRLLKSGYRIRPRRGLGDCNPWNLHVVRTQLDNPDMSEIRTVAVDFDNSEYLEPGSDLSDLSVQWALAYYESGGNPYYLNVWRHWFRSYQSCRPDPTITIGMLPNYGCKGTVFLNPTKMTGGDARVARYRRAFTAHLLKVLECDEYMCAGFGE